MSISYGEDVDRAENQSESARTGPARRLFGVPALLITSIFGRDRRYDGKAAILKKIMRSALEWPSSYTDKKHKVSVATNVPDDFGGRTCEPVALFRVAQY